MFDSNDLTDVKWRHSSTKIRVNIGSGNGLLIGDTKPLPQPMLTCDKKCHSPKRYSNEILQESNHKNIILKLHIQNQKPPLSGGNEINKKTRVVISSIMCYKYQSLATIATNRNISVFILWSWNKYPIWIWSFQYVIFNVSIIILFLQIMNVNAKSIVNGCM